MDALDLFKSTLSLGPTTRSNPDPLWEWEEIRRSHHAAHSALTVDQSHLLMVQVFSRARLQHPDLDEFVGFMVVATKALVPAWNAISLEEYIEFLYCAVKHADFMKEIRQEGSSRPCESRIQ